jgi:hypothetical protein
MGMAANVAAVMVGGNFPNMREITLITTYDRRADASHG